MSVHEVQSGMRQGEKDECATYEFDYGTRLSGIGQSRFVSDIATGGDKHKDRNDEADGCGEHLQRHIRCFGYHLE